MFSRICMASGGLVSAEAAHRTAERHGRDGLSLLFADTRIEDEDLYRFLIESAAVTLGVGLTPAVRQLAAAALRVPAVEDDRMPARKRELAWIATEAAALIPGLHWVSDGRTPWEVFEDEKFVGNSRVDPCSKLLKRQLMDRWCAGNSDPAAARYVFGLDWLERPRIEGDGSKPGHRARLASAGRVGEYPMNEKPYLTREDTEALWRSRGVEPSRSYADGFLHDNCGGMCVKMGLVQARHLLRTRPRRYLWHERQEQAAFAAIGPTAKPFLRYRGGGATRRVSLRELREHAEAFPLLDEHHGNGCGCAIDEPEA